MRRTSIGRRLAGILAVSVLLVALAALWQLRPGLPRLPESLSGPLTTGELRSVAGFAAWLALVALALQLLARTIRSAKRREARDPSRLVGSGRRAHLDAPDTSSFFASAPYVLTIPARPESDAAPSPPAPTVRIDASDPSPTERAIKIRLLGPFAIDGCRRQRRALRSASRELIAYLALHPEGASREQLPDVLWPNEKPERARRRLWQSVTDARAHLNDALRVDGDRYLLDRKLASVDVDEFEQLLAQSEQGHDSQTLLERALALVRGEPLAGSDYLWADGDIRRLRAAVAELLSRLVQERLAAGEPRAALAAAEQGLAVDPLNEELWRLALEAEATLGLREAVIDRYEKLTKLLDERLGLEPDRETRSLYRSLLGQT